MDQGIIIFFDGHCALCRRTARRLRMLDWLDRLRLIDFREEHLRRQFAPDIPCADLDRVLHIRMPDGTVCTGFSGFRRLCWRLPPLWLLAPFLYLPGARSIGDRMYERVAESRRKCTHRDCCIR